MPPPNANANANANAMPINAQTMPFAALPDISLPFCHKLAIFIIFSPI
jgi:hypothetical protein